MPHIQTCSRARDTWTDIKSPAPPLSQPQGGGRGQGPGAKVSASGEPGWATAASLSGSACLVSPPSLPRRTLQPGTACCPPLPGVSPQWGHTHIRGMNREWGPRAILKPVILGLEEGDRSGTGALTSLGQGLGGSCPLWRAPDAGPCPAPGARTPSTEQGGCA